MSGRYTTLGFQAFDFALVVLNRLFIGHPFRRPPPLPFRSQLCSERVERPLLFSQENRATRLLRPAVRAGASLEPAKTTTSRRRGGENP